MTQPFTTSAGVYDAIYDTEAFDYDGHAEAIIALVEERCPGAETLLEVGCGTGLFLERLAKRFAVTGVDISAQMLLVARGRLAGVPFHEGDMRDFSLPERFDAVVCLFSSIGYMETLNDLGRAVHNLVRHLRPGGVVVFDGWLRPETAIDGHVALGSAHTDDLVVARVSFTRVVDGLTDMEMHHLVGRPGIGVEAFVERHRMRLTTDEEYLAVMRGAGLSDTAVVDGYAGRGRFVGVTP